MMNGFNNNFIKKRIGWFCSYVPAEIIIAAGLEPVRIQGQVEMVKEADSYMSPNNCPYLKNILDSGLQNKFKNLEGIIFTSSCDGMRRLYDIWTHHVQMPFSCMLEIPKNKDGNAIGYFSEQLYGLKTRLEKVFEVNISDDKLGKAIGLMNEHRKIMIKLFERQKESPSPYKGSELLALCLEEMTRPKDETTEKVKNFLERAEPPKSLEDKSPRILVIGNVIDKLNLFQMVESVGGSVVAFDTCLGLRHYSGAVEEGRDPIESIARRYLLKPSCARMPGFVERIERVEELIQDYSVDGIVYSIVKFCDYGMFEAPVIGRSLQNRGVPFLILENDYIWRDEGRVRTRIEAFVEMIKGDLN
jgi:benzoyl-CoA reductase/2-hydroxyglutaryl-CoA dehydratase subunit BcrC/BadD/HgdB